MLTDEVRRAIQRVREAQGYYRPYLETFALERGLLRGHSTYVPLIILTRSRSGSNFLRGLLNSHSQITVFGELFQNRDSIGWALPGYRQSKRTLSLFRQNPIRFLEKKVFRCFPTHTAAVGFKIFYYHAQDDEWKAVWEYLQAHKELRVIHLKRKNILETHLSRVKAQLTDEWVNLTPVRGDSRAIPLDYEACLADFVRTRTWEREYDAMFQEHPRIEVLYEELSCDHVAEMKRIQSFLGVDYEAVTPQTHRQSHQRLSDAISNYWELKERFAGTPWADFFTD
jgi:LPS sulfotransferase NodH